MLKESDDGRDEAGDKPSVVLIATGGTIAGTAPTATAPGYTAAQLPLEQLLDTLPALADLAHIRTEQIAAVGSQNMSDAIWLRLAARVKALLRRSDVDGLVITHGTDTLEETAWFLDLVVNSDKAVVMTAAMRAANSLSADGPLNLYQAVAVAADRHAAHRGVLIAANDAIHSARALTKGHSSAVQGLESPERGLAGNCNGGHIRFFTAPKRPRHDTLFALEGVEALPRVDIVYMHVDASADMIDHTVAAGARGIVIAGVGNGNMPDSCLQAVTRAIQQGVVVVRSSRINRGTVGRNIEIDDSALGTIAALDLNPAKARVLLKLALLQSRDAEAIQELFEHC
jgi:L-asparaginase